LAVSDDTSIYVDADVAATLNDGAATQTDFRSLQEAVLAWLALPSAQKIRANVKVIGGPVYTGQQIHRRKPVQYVSAPGGQRRHQAWPCRRVEAAR
jgi:hypothetical protein